MPALSALAPPGRRPPADPKPVAPHREQAVVSCAPLGYWTERDAGGTPAYRHRLGLHADLDYQDPDSETASVLVSGDALAALLDCLRGGQRIDGHLIGVIGPLPDGGVTIAIVGADPGTWWRLHAEPDGRYDLSATGELWYPVPAQGCDRLAR